MLYTYKCSNEKCQQVSYINHPMADESERFCPICKSKVYKLFSNSKTIYKTKGFYNTDYD